MLVGKQFGPFKVEKELGSGAMGSVYRGTDETTGKRVAIKIINPGLTKNQTAIERFLRESKVLKRLVNPNIAKYLGSGRYHGTPFYIMEYLEGESLDHVLARRVKITWEELVTIGKQLCSALQTAHENGIIHRDLKPSNLMMLPDGTVKLTDFGIAKDTDAEGLTATHSTLGTAAYMSPEQCRGAKDITYKSDLYSMGIMFYELVTGKKPFQSDNPMDVFLMHVKGTCARPSTFAMDLPIWIDNLIMQLMEKNPDARPVSAAKVAEELESIAQKVADQASAGVDRVTKRRADRTTQDQKIDATDKDIARALLGKKTKKKKKPFYTETWFTATSVGAVLAALAITVYIVFFKPPSGDALYNQVAETMKTPKFDSLKSLRDAREPIAEFLQLHPDDSRAREMRQWLDRVDLEAAQFIVSNNRPDKDDPDDAWKAIEDEKTGRLDEARRRWVNVVGLKTSEDPVKRGWGLYAEKSLGELMQLALLEKDVQDRVRREVDWKDNIVAKHPADRLALDATKIDDPRIAGRKWDDLRRMAEGVPEYRLYYLLALKKSRDSQ
jgi:serine/threonine-protein kinase